MANGDTEHKFAVPLVLAAGTRVKLRATSDTDNVDVYGDIEIILGV